MGSQGGVRGDLTGLQTVAMPPIRPSERGGQKCAHSFAEKNAAHTETTREIHAASYIDLGRLDVRRIAFCEAACTFQPASLARLVGVRFPKITC